MMPLNLEEVFAIEDNAKVDREIQLSVQYFEVSTRDEAIKLARAYSCEFEDEGREWLVGTAPHSYNDPAYRTETHVLEGSGPKGYVVIADRRMSGDAIAMNAGLFPTAVFSW
jgi:hypothetical protein